MKKKTISLRLDEKLLREVEKLARRDLRSINSEIIYMLQQQLETCNAEGRE